MSYYEKISCRIAIQVCIGHFPDGRERHRTFSMKGVDPDAPLKSIAAVIRALAPLLAYPITKVRKVTKRVILIYEEAALSVPHDNAEAVMNAGRIIPMLIPMRPAVGNQDIKRRRKALTGVNVLTFPALAALLPLNRRFCLSLRRGMREKGKAKLAGFISGRAPPWNLQPRLSYVS